MSIIASIPLELEILFGDRGNSGGYLGKGWSGQENGHVWAVGTISEILIPHVKEKVDHLLQIHLWPYVHQEVLPAQSVSIIVNGVAAGTLMIRQPEIVTHRIPAALIDPARPLRIHLHHPDATPPKKFISDGDPRELAVAVKWLALWRMPSVSAGSLAAAAT